MTERYMPSIFPECDKLKQAYDKCFSDFFEKFISAETLTVSNPCDRLHETYRYCIEKENARQMGVIASDFTTRSQEPLNQKIHTLISGLHELDHLKNQFMDVKIPLELLEYLDQGKNPQLYTKECLERTLNKNKEMNGKIEMYKKFRAMLLKELGEEMPNDMVLYRNLRDRKDASPQHENCNEDASD